MTVSVPYTFTNNTPADATEVNANFDAVVNGFDDYVARDGSVSMTGALVLPNATPTLDNHAARKKYVDDSIAAISVVPADGSITTAKLASDAVTTVKILDDAVTAAKLADASVDLGSAVTTGSLPLSKLENVAYSTFTATFKQGTTTVTSTTNWARYRREGRRIIGYAKVTLNAGGGASNEVSVETNLPAPLNNASVAGSGVFLEQGGGFYPLIVEVNSNNFKFFYIAAGMTSTYDDSRFGNNVIVASGDYINFHFDYEAAS